MSSKRKPRETLGKDCLGVVESPSLEVFKQIRQATVRNDTGIAGFALGQEDGLADLLRSFSAL